MDAILEPLDDLRRDALAFIKSSDARVLFVEVDEALREQAVQVLTGLEWHPSNQSQFLSLVGSGGEPTPRGWPLRVQALVTAYEELRTSYQRAGGAVLDELKPASEGQADAASFLSLTRAIAGELGAPESGPDGLLLILCSSGSERDQRELGEVIARSVGPEKPRIRWICIGAEPLSTLASAVPATALAYSAARIDPDRQDDEIESMLASLAASGGLPGQAVPEDPIPRHPTDPKPGRGVPGLDIPEGFPPAALGAFVEGVRAVRARDWAGSVRHQREAMDRCLATGANAIAVEMELLLGTYSLQACSANNLAVAPALEVFRSAAARATALGLPLAASKSHLVLGHVAASAGDDVLAGASFRNAADQAVLAGQPALAIAALAAGADLLTARGVDAGAVRVLLEALASGDHLTDAEARLTSIAACRDGLAEIAARHAVVVPNLARAADVPPVAPGVEVPTTPATRTSEERA